MLAHIMNYYYYYCYLPPSNSIYGRNASSFMAHFLSIIYKIAEYDAVYILGDVNSRIGDKINFVSTINHIKIDMLLIPLQINMVKYF